MASGTKRLQYVDAVRGTAILWIILYHLLAPCAGKTVINHLTAAFTISFFFFSGFFHRSGKRSITENIANRAKALMAPFFKYSLSFWVIGSVYLVLTRAEPLREAFLCLRNFFAGCIWNRVIQGWFGWEYYSLGKRYYYLADFWFLIAMLFASILFFLIADAMLASKARCILAVIVLFAATGALKHFQVDLPYNIQLVPFWTAFMLLGAFAGQQKLMELPSLSKGARWGIALLALAAGITVSMLCQPFPNLFRGSFGEGEVLSMLKLIAGTVPFIWGIGLFFALIEEAGVRIKELAWFGSHSLIFYVSHMFLAWIICTVTGFSLQYGEIITGDILIKSILLALACIALGIVWNILAEKLRPNKE